MAVYAEARQRFVRAQEVHIMDSGTYVSISRGILYNVGTAAILIALYVVLVLWQPQWKQLFESVGGAAPEVAKLNVNLSGQMHTANTSMSVVSANMPKVVTNMEALVTRVDKLANSIGHMEMTMDQMSQKMPTAAQMEAINYQMHEMRRGFTAPGIMNNMSPFQ
jgi:hypothetical protein